MSTKPDVRVNEAGAPRRCAFCHADLPARYRECQGCGVATHTDCLRELGRCPTEGCAKPPRPKPPEFVYHPTLDPRTSRVVLEVLVLVSLALWVFGWQVVAGMTVLLHTIVFGFTVSSDAVMVAVVCAVLSGPAVVHGVLAPMAARRGTKHPHVKAILAALGGAVAWLVWGQH